MRTLWNKDWLFASLPSGSGYRDLKKAEMRRVSLPHDCLIENAGDLYRTCDLWYVKDLARDPAWDGKTVEAEFDGAYMDADVLVNGSVILTHRYGYTAFRADLTEHLKPGSNEVAVHIRHRSPNSRWYSGAGIYRDVTLSVLPERHMIPGGFRADTAREGDAWRLDFGAELEGEGALPEYLLTDADGETVARGRMRSGRESLVLKNILPWSPDSPALYRLRLTLEDQTEEMNVGFRETAFDPDRGFSLNGERLKLHGVCLHHDLGALGSAYHQAAAERQLRLMKKMGVNAVRTSHNPPARAFLDLCDSLGLMVIDEAYDMWEEPKTAFDNARFFPDTWKKTVAEWIRRDRCHPCVIMWSIGNEIHDMQASERGMMWTRLLTDEVRLHDAVHAPVTFGSNYMPWEGAQKCADIVKLPGYNYAERYYDAHHAAHPDWVIYGSETASHVQSRGVYHFPLDRAILSDDDLQCSALGNSRTSWGTQDAERMLREEEERPYTLGQFIWSGIDYIGEPTPYHTRNSYFGQADTACFPKDTYYMYQAAWSKERVIHIGVTWDWNAGQTVDVPVWTNMEYAELFLNGRSLGVKSRGRGYRCVWRVPYEEGAIEAVAWMGNDRENAVRDRRASFGDSVSLRLTREKGTLFADGESLAFLTVEALDREGRTVENANDRVFVSVEGCGCLMGLDNGDSTDEDGYQVSSRRLFAGKLLIIAGALEEPGEIRVAVSSPGLRGDETVIGVLPCAGEKRSRIPPAIGPGRESPRAVRKIVLRRLDAGDLDPAHPEAEFEVSALPPDARYPLSFRAQNADGIPLPGARVRREGNRVFITVKGDGEAYLRASADNGADHPRVLSSYGVRASGFGKTSLDPYTFVSAGLYDISRGGITPGNEHGISFSHDGESTVGFGSVDFGPDGSDTVTLPVFALNGDEYRIEMWDGDGGDRRLIDVLRYQKPSIWNVYQEETWKLPVRLRGEHTLCFTMRNKVHLKGFIFEKQPRLSRWVAAGEADIVYGDTFRREGDAVLGIGNNVSLIFGALDFGEGGPRRLTLRGATDLAENTVSLRFRDENGEQSAAILPFKGGEGEQAFTVTVPGGVCEMSFVFLPGSRFDFYAFRLEEI